MAEMDATRKTCSRCSVEREIDRFPVNAKCRGGRSTICLDCFRSYRKAWEAKNPERHRQNKRRYRQDPEKRRAAQRARYLRVKADGAWRARKSLARAVRYALNGRKSASAFSLLGYSPEELVEHLQRQFLPGMTWSNYGAWHIDHIVPVASFDVAGDKSDAELRRAWALPNLRPLWAEDNLKKRATRTHLL